MWHACKLYQQNSEKVSENRPAVKKEYDTTQDASPSLTWLEAGWSVEEDAEAGLVVDGEAGGLPHTEADTVLQPVGLTLHHHTSPVQNMRKVHFGEKKILVKTTSYKVAF